MATPSLQLLLDRLEQRSPLGANDRRAVLGLPTKVRAFVPGGFVVREGEPARFCAVLLSGYAFRQKLTGEGSRQILSIHLPGEALDFQNVFLDVADHNVQMLTRGDVAFIARRDLQELTASYPAVAHAVFVEAMVEASIFREWIVNVGRRDARSRLAHVLCELAVRLQSYGLSRKFGYELPMTQADLADVLGLTPVHVNRVLRALEAEGLVERSSKRVVRFPNWQRLRDLADFNERYLHVPAMH